MAPKPVVYLSKDIAKIVDKIDYSRLGENVAIKVHFGEKGCVTFTNPAIVKAVYDRLVSLGKKATLVECNVLYRGARTNRTDHIKTAKEHGFDFASIDILDGEKGEEFIEVPVENGLANPVKIGKGLTKYDSMIVLTHFKGHSLAGYGGVFKNIGMGLGSRAGKLHMHSDVKPFVDKEKCVGCGVCVKNCDFGGLFIKNAKAEIDKEKCVGCAMCIAVCPQGAIQIPWTGSTSENLQKKIVDYTRGVIKIIPKEKMVLVNVLQNITSRCDCAEEKQEPMMEDIGILLATDMVAIDKASLDLAIKHSAGKFDNINSVDKNILINYASEKGLGAKNYNLVNLDKVGSKEKTL